MTVGDAQAAFEAVPQHGFAKGPSDRHHETGRISSVADPECFSLDPAPAISAHSRRRWLHSQPFAAFAPAAGYDRAAAGGAHAFAKPVLVPAFAIAGLESAFQRFFLSSIA